MTMEVKRINPSPIPAIQSFSYTKSDSGPDADYPRAVIYDLACELPEYYTKELVDDFHTSVVEFPTYTYVGKL